MISTTRSVPRRRRRTPGYSSARWTRYAQASRPTAKKENSPTPRTRQENRRFGAAPSPPRWHVVASNARAAVSRANWSSARRAKKTRVAPSVARRRRSLPRATPRTNSRASARRPGFARSSRRNPNASRAPRRRMRARTRKRRARRRRRRRALARARFVTRATKPRNFGYARRTGSDSSGVTAKPRNSRANSPNSPPREAARARGKFWTRRRARSSPRDARRWNRTRRRTSPPFAPSRRCSTAKPRKNSTRERDGRRRTRRTRTSGPPRRSLRFANARRRRRRTRRRFARA